MRRGVNTRADPKEAKDWPERRKQTQTSPGGVAKGSGALYTSTSVAILAAGQSRRQGIAQASREAQPLDVATTLEAQGNKQVIVILINESEPVSSVLQCRLRTIFCQAREVPVIAVRYDTSCQVQSA